MTRDILVGLVLFSVCGIASAHRGALDHYDCHRNRKAGSYHCHKGPLAGRVFANRQSMLIVLSGDRPRSGASEGIESPPAVSGTVTAVIDGDTIRIRADDGTPLIIRLGEIDAPERGQAYAAEAKQALSELVAQRPVTVRVKEIDAYGRTVGRVYCEGVDVSAELVSRGAAWVYRQYATDENLFDLESAARKERRGLWARTGNEP